MARAHWQNGVAHFGSDVATVVPSYFSEAHRRGFVVGAAGFDPRSRRIAEMLAAAMGDRLIGLFIREERGTPDAGLLVAAEANAAALQAAVPASEVAAIEIFGVDGAPVGGARIGALVRSEEHTSELQSLMRISYAVFCLKKKNKAAH